MRVVEVTDRNGTLGVVLARFALDGDVLPDVDRMPSPDVSVLLDIRESLGDLIKVEAKKAKEALEAVEVQARKDADLVSGVMEVEQKTLAAAEAHAAHVAAMAVKAQEAVADAEKKMKKPKVTT